jgi:uncharacterized membrane protein
MKEDVVNHRFTQGNISIGERAADGLAKYAGSWVFILSFMLFLVIWMYLNIHAWQNSWDPYPFILLNLVLSCVAALQAPIILMSQNRQTEKDRIKADYDYKVNRKAEREIEEILKRLKRIEARGSKKK